jgi:hypothetical protein
MPLLPSVRRLLLPVASRSGDTVANRFKNKTLATYYEGCVVTFNDKRSVLFNADGTPCHSNSIATNFWRGYNNVAMNWDKASKETFAYAAYRAGEDCRKSQEP